RADLVGFAVGFSLTEGVVSSPDEVLSVEPVEAGEGIDMQITLASGAGDRFQARRRLLAGPVGCGLCGIESIEEAVRQVPSVASASLQLDAADIATAARLLARRQRLHRETGAVHAAGFYVPGEGMIAAREDAGRHNALDKLAGALARADRAG